MSDWKKALINKSATTTIRDALRALDVGGVRTAFIIDNNNTLIGLVAEGDIRRGLLGNLNMDDPVQKVLNHKPFKLKKYENVFKNVS